ncbi:Translation initiation factor IF-1 [Candidatus Hodgkinia cicadicola]|nr:Translation initiation factor IF-1 [Candidatus Hodgkinia cicadicola]
MEFKNKKINGVFGEVIKILPGGMFRVKLNDGQLLVAHVSFKIKMDRTPILKGNIVFMQRADNKSKNAIILKKYTA